MSKASKWAITKRIIRQIWQSSPAAVILYALRSILRALIPFVPLFFTARIIDELLGSRDLSRLSVLVGWTVGITLLFHLGNQLIVSLLQRSRQTLYFAEGEALLKAGIRVDFATLESPEFQRLYRDYDDIRNMKGSLFSYVMMEQLASLLQSFCTIVAAVVLSIPVFANGGPLLWVLLAALVVASCVYVLLSQKQNTRLVEGLLDVAHTNRLFFFFNNMVGNYRAGKEIRLYRAQDFVVGEATKLINFSSPKEKKLYGALGRYSGAAGAVNELFGGLAYAYVGVLALSGAISIGSIVQVVGAFVRLSDGLTKTATHLSELHANADYFRSYFDILDTPPTNHLGTLPTEKRDDCEYEFEFHNVSYRYPTAEDWAVRNLNLKLRIGERLAVVGMNGSGKTTMIKLLCRLYDPQEGMITLNGIDIRKYNFEEYIALFAAVFQDFKLFSFSVGSNVAASQDYNRERVLACMEQAGVGKELAPETILYCDFDKDGIEISGGEAQKLALARALYKDAPFIVLDEPTAALDPVSEFEVYRSFNALVGNRTAIYISHRLSSCRFCENIAVFHEGRLIQQGSHNALIADASGKYHELWHAQAQYYT